MPSAGGRTKKASHQNSGLPTAYCPLPTAYLLLRGFTIHHE